MKSSWSCPYCFNLNESEFDVGSMGEVEEKSRVRIEPCQDCGKKAVIDWTVEIETRTTKLFSEEK